MGRRVRTPAVRTSRATASIPASPRELSVMPGRVDAAAVEARLHVGAGGEDGVQVRGHHHRRRARRAGEGGEHVPHLVGRRVAIPCLAQALQHARAPLALAERRRGDAHQLQLVAERGFVGAVGQLADGTEGGGQGALPVAVSGVGRMMMPRRGGAVNRATPGFASACRSL
jgi:hypothetical protein